MGPLGRIRVRLDHESMAYVVRLVPFYEKEVISLPFCHENAVRWQLSARKSLHQNLTMPACWSTSSLQNHKKINYCCLSHPVYGIFLGQPEQTKTQLLTQLLENFKLNIWFILFFCWTALF